MTEYPYTNIEMVVNNVVVQNLGVKHTQKFFGKHYSFFEEQIGNSKAVIMEQPLQNQFFSVNNFFNSIGRIAASKNLPVYIADTGWGDSRDTPVWWADLFQFVFGSYLFFNSAQSLGSRLKDRYAFQDGKTGISRRDFLKKTAKTLGFGIAGLSLALGTTPGNGLAGFISKKHKLNDDLSYGKCDFRNIMIAEGVDKITRIQEGPIVTIHGDYHPCHIMYYLRNPGWRKIKKALYLPWQLVQNTQVRKWECKSGNWKLTAKF